MTTEPLDPAKVMAEHRDHHPTHWVEDIDADRACCPCMLPEFGNRSCETYRLAEQCLAERQAGRDEVIAAVDGCPPNYHGPGGAIYVRDLSLTLAPFRPNQTDQPTGGHDE